MSSKCEYGVIDCKDCPIHKMFPSGGPTIIEDREGMASMGCLLAKQEQEMAFEKEREYEEYLESGLFEHESD